MVVARGPGPGPGTAGKGGVESKLAAGVRFRKEVHGEDGAGKRLRYGGAGQSDVQGLTNLKKPHRAFCCW